MKLARLLGLIAAVAWASACSDGPAGPADGSPTALSVTPSSVGPVDVGDEVRLVVEPRDAGGQIAAGASVSWTSSDPQVATVSADGLVTARGPGTAGIMAEAGGASATVQFSVANPERAVLEALYHATGGPGWTNNSNWLTDAPLQDWHGVLTDSEGRVARLILQDNQLTGAIPAELGDLASLQGLFLDRNRLTGAIPAELGRLASLQWLLLNDNELTGAIPAELGALASLRGLFLDGNRLTGGLPAELGALATLSLLVLNGNSELAGALPLALSSLSALELFRYDGTGLCVPADTSFRAWLSSIANHQGTGLDCADDRNILEALYHATDGANWTDNANWLTDAPLGDWHGVTTDSEGRVTWLHLQENQLLGEIPAELGALAGLEELLLYGNSGLAGALPLALSSLSALQQFRYDGTGLCVPADALFRAWLNAIANHRSTGVDCAPLSDRDILEALYHATGGQGWTNNGNWLTDAPLHDWHGVLTDSEGRVVRLILQGNQLTGEIPAELGDLASLQGLFVNRNQLTGEIPAELGGLASLQWLLLNDNELTGEIPAELGGLASLRGLYLAGNQLAGGIPPELGGLADLSAFVLNDNPELTGALPLALSSLSALQQFRYDGTGLCVPADTSFRAWLNTIANHWGTGLYCPGGVVSLETSSVEVPEGGTAVLKVVLSMPPTSPIDVAYTLGTDADQATPDANSADYGASSGSIEIGTDVTEVSLEIPILDDDDIEPTREVFTFTLDTPPADAVYTLGSTSSATVTILEGVCDRTPQVRDEIIRQAAVNDCMDPDHSDLEAIQVFDLSESSDDAAALQALDFAGLTGMHTLDLRGNKLTALPEGVFSGLSNLVYLNLSGAYDPTTRSHGGQLTALPEGVFSGLSNLEALYLRGHQLTELPQDVFADLSRLRELYLDSNQIARLQRGVFFGSAGPGDSGIGREAHLDIRNRPRRAVRMGQPDHRDV